MIRYNVELSMPHRDTVVLSTRKNKLGNKLKIHQCLSLTPQSLVLPVNVTVTGLEPIIFTPVKTSLVSGKIRTSRDHNAK